MSRVGLALEAVTGAERCAATRLPARSVGPPEADETLTDTWSPPLGGVARGRPSVGLVGPEQDTAVTARKRPGIETLKAFGETGSEERRVGEEGRTRGAADQLKKKEGMEAPLGPVTEAGKGR